MTSRLIGVYELNTGRHARGNDVTHQRGFPGDGCSRGAYPVGILYGSNVYYRQFSLSCFPF